MKKKLLIGATALVLSVATVFTLTGAANSTSQGVPVRTVTLERETLTKNVSATGTVYSRQSTDVYSALSYPVKTVHVQVGDKVTVGDVLAELDVSGLESDISQKKASVSASQASANQNLTSAKSDLETYRRNAANGNDTNLVNAESAVTTAELDVQNSKLDVQNAVLDIQNAELDVQNASNNLFIARRDHKDARDDGADDSELNRLRDNVRSCETALDKAETSLEKAKSNLEKSKSNLDKVEANLDKANASNKAAKVSSGDTLVTYENKVKSAQLNTNFGDQWISIQKMESDLEKAVVTAPVSGTVTAVYAAEGGSGSGKLFVIQETDSLKVITNIKEYDIDMVSTGDRVTIKADATGDKVFDGSLTKIAPTSTQTAAGGIQNSTDAEYESEVAVSSAKGGLKIGMNTRLSIITQEKKGVYAVPYESVVTDESGETLVFVAAIQEDGSYIARAVTVKTGMETDLYVEISSDNLTDGMLVIKNIEGIQDGTPVIIG